MTTTSPAIRSRFSPTLWILGLALVCFLWAFWTTLTETRHVWSTNPQYSHGYLVPLFGLFLLWLRRDRCNWEQLRPSWWGLPLLLAGCALRLAGTYYHFEWFDRLAIIPTLAGLVVMLGGGAAWRWSWPALLYLGFMIPLPYTVATSLSGPLQTVATLCSTYILQTLGLPAIAEGNVILLNDHSIGIVEACSGLRMLVVFFAMSTGMVMVIKRPLVDKVIMVASSIPIALVSNVIRVTGTGLLYEANHSEAADAFFHDVGGYLMMPLALVFLWVEMKLLQYLFMDQSELPSLPTLGRQRPATAPTRRTPLTPATAPTARREAGPNRPGARPPRRTPYTRPGQQPPAAAAPHAAEVEAQPEGQPQSAAEV